MEPAETLWLRRKPLLPKADVWGARGRTTGESFVAFCTCWGRIAGGGTCPCIIHRPPSSLRAVLREGGPDGQAAQTNRSNSTNFFA